MGDRDNPDDQGWRMAADAAATDLDCPYRSALLIYERGEWLRGFAAGDSDRKLPRRL